MHAKMDRGLSLMVLLVVALGMVAPTTSSLPKDILDQIEFSQAGVNQIRNTVLNGNRKYKTFDRLAQLSDRFPRRLAGSQILEDSIDYVMDEMRKEGFENVHGENVTIPSWTRGREYGEILTPMRRSMYIMALGSSIGTNGNLTGRVVVVRSFEELEAKKAEVPGKIVVYNQPWKGYSATVQYRSRGATEASKRGAIGALVRSVTDFSIYSPHTGLQTYGINVTKIPVASITVEDAELLQRYYDRNENITVSMYMEAQNHPDAISRNVVAEIKGSEFPDQVVIFGGHIDSWDVGTGSMDDGAGVMIAWEALSVIKQLNLKPKRTLRVVLWTAEENGLHGGKAYYEAHKNEADKVSLIMESDHGVFNPKGIHFTGSGLARAIMEEIVKTLNDLNTSTVVDGGGDSSDTAWWLTERKVPGVELYSANENYFFFHHSHGDTMSMLNKDHLDRATVLWATTVYSVANLNDILPRTGDHPSPATSRALTLTPSLASLGLTLIPSLAAAALIFRLN